MKQSFLGENVINHENKVEDDPFTRKSGKMRMVSGRPKRDPNSIQPKTSGNFKFFINIFFKSTKVVLN